MDAWGDFAAGLIGALIGGGASFGVQIYISRRDTYARRLAAIERVADASRAILAAGADITPTNKNTDAVYDSLIDGRMAVGGVRMVLRPREQPIATWLRGRMKKLGIDASGTAEAGVVALDDIEETITWLAQWAAGQRKVSTFVTHSEKDTDAPDARALRSRVKR